MMLHTLQIIGLSSVLLLLSRHSLSVKLKDQTVKCNPQTMQITFEFAEPFYGVAYAEHFYNNQACRSIGSGEKILIINIPRNAESEVTPYCGVRTDKTRNEFHVGLILSSTKDILVEGMQTFDVVCKYVLMDAFTVSLSAIDALSIRAANNEQQDSSNVIVRGEGKAVAPSLDMSIRKGHGVDGPKIESAVIGERITLDVAFGETGGYGLRMYNCIAHDGSKSLAGRVELVDSDGCARYIEKVIEAPLREEVDRAGKHLLLYLYGFQFSTSDLVYFECQIKSCLNSCSINSTDQAELNRDDRLKPVFFSKQCNRTNDRHVGNLERLGFLRESGSSETAAGDEQPGGNSYNVRTTLRFLHQPVELGGAQAEGLRRNDVLIVGDDVDNNNNVNGNYSRETIPFKPSIAPRSKDDTLAAGMSSTVVVTLTCLLAVGCIAATAISACLGFRTYKEIRRNMKLKSPIGSTSASTYSNSNATSTINIAHLNRQHLHDRTLFSPSAGISPSSSFATTMSSASGGNQARSPIRSPALYH